MWDACKLLWSLLVGLFRSRASLEAENLVLRQQIIVLRRTAPKRLCFSAFDRLIFAGLYRLFPDVRDALAVVRPETVIRWHRAGFRAYWRWRSRPRGGRPKVPLEIHERRYGPSALSVPASRWVGMTHTAAPSANDERVVIGSSPGDDVRTDAPPVRQQHVRPCGRRGKTPPQLGLDGKRVAIEKRSRSSF